MGAAVGDAAYKTGGALVIRDVGGAVLKIGDQSVEKGDHIFRPFTLPHDLSHDAQRLIHGVTVFTKVAVIQNNHRNTGLSEKRHRIMAHGGIGFENHLGQGIEG